MSKLKGRMTRSRTASALFVGLAVVVVQGVASGCADQGSSASSVQSSSSISTVDSASTSVAEAPAPSTTSASAGSQLSTAAILSNSTPEGDKAQATIKIGTQVSAANADSFAVSCGESSFLGGPRARGLLVPFSVDVVVESSLPASVKVDLGTFLISTSPTQQCDSSDGIDPSLFASIPNAVPGQDYKFEGWLYYGNAITPAHPDGDPQAMKEHDFAQPQLALFGSNPLETIATGTHVCQANGVRSHPYVYIVNRPADC